MKGLVPYNRKCTKCKSEMILEEYKGQTVEVTRKATDFTFTCPDCFHTRKVKALRVKFADGEEGWWAADCIELDEGELNHKQEQVDD